MVIPPLPGDLWKRLIDRYYDPDEGKTYKDAGGLKRLGTIKDPYYDLSTLDRESKSKFPKEFSPELRLAHYFSNIVYPQINRASELMVRAFPKS